MTVHDTYGSPSRDTLTGCTCTPCVALDSSVSYLSRQDCVFFSVKVSVVNTHSRLTRCLVMFVCLGYRASLAFAG